ncbi:hypothetical protein V6Z11_D09G084500 [Gossypium hirsutum]
MVELSMTMEDIVQLIEQESDAELRTQASIHLEFLGLIMDVNRLIGFPQSVAK